MEMLFIVLGGLLILFIMVGAAWPKLFVIVPRFLFVKSVKLIFKGGKGKKSA